jgi:hypothetical protein
MAPRVSGCIVCQGIWGALRLLDYKWDHLNFEHCVIIRTTESTIPLSTEIRQNSTKFNSLNHILTILYSLYNSFTVIKSSNDYFTAENFKSK